MRSVGRAVAGTALLGLTLVACVPNPVPGPAPTTAPVAAPTTAPPTTAPPQVPQIAAFTSSVTSAPSPLTTGFRWTISDPEGDTLTCRLDLEDDGTYDITITPCDNTSTRTRSFTTPGSRTVRLEVSDGTASTTATVGLAVGAVSSDAYSITLRLGSGMSMNQTTAFMTAAVKWAGIIKTGQPNTTLNLGADSCATGTPAYSGVVDDLLIDAQIITIDGPGGILGQAGPCLVRSSNGIPVYGVMQFDSADVASLETSGQLTNTIVHEMGHILGVGTTWGSLLHGAGTSTPTFIGPAAVGAWRELGGPGDVPVENSGGSGTRDAHWRETIFRTELMTGYLNSSNQLSAMTAASLGDQGYGVDLAGADAYTLPTSLIGPSARAASVVGDMVMITPTGSV